MNEGYKLITQYCSKSNQLSIFCWQNYSSIWPDQLDQVKNSRRVPCLAELSDCWSVQNNQFRFLPIRTWSSLVSRRQALIYCRRSDWPGYQFVRVDKIKIIYFHLDTRGAIYSFSWLIWKHQSNCQQFLAYILELLDLNTLKRCWIIFQAEGHYNLPFPVHFRCL